MVFCKGDINSITKFIKALSHLSLVTGLKANTKKCNIFLAGLDDNTNEKLLALTCFSRDNLQLGTLDFPYYQRSEKRWNANS